MKTNNDSSAAPAGNGVVSASEQLATLYNIPRLRTDTWNRLRDAARRLRRVRPRGDEGAEMRRVCTDALDTLERIESYCAFPGRITFTELRRTFERGEYKDFGDHTIQIARLLMTGAFRRLNLAASSLRDYSDLLDMKSVAEAVQGNTRENARPYFEVLVVDDFDPADAAEVRARMRGLRKSSDEFMYELVTVNSYEDALFAILINPNIQSCVLRNIFPFDTGRWREIENSLYTLLGEDRNVLREIMPSDRTLLLGRHLKALRPELDLYLVTDAPVENVAGDPSATFRRLFYQQEDYQDLHLSILKGIHERFETPFFEALRRYSQKPTGMFHALPISRGRTIAKSHWIGDLGRFYGSNVFLAETSATTGGLDSLLQPTGSLKRAQELAARAFGSRRTYFVTNGTSTANKIVLQALTRPGDIVMLAHDCHKSHPYAVILGGASPVYLDAYPLDKYTMYGGVPLREIKRQLLELRRAGKLDRVRMLLLTNLTFDGITYDPLRIMLEVLAIKPDMIFVWDEAWFAYGRFSPTLRRRTAMESSTRLLNLLRSDEYRARHAEWKAGFGSPDEDSDAWLEQKLLPDPDLARVRVYATHSTHKTLTALRQGSMIHVHDQDFELRVQDVFNEAYMTHTSTSPNYQILATLDVGRRQVELEGYDLVQRSIELAMTLRERVTADPQLSKYFSILGAGEMVPREYRPSGLEAYYDAEKGWNTLEEAWTQDEFVLDPTRVTLHVGRTGMDGDSFKKMLMDRFDIHINKTSRNTVLFLIHIGMSRGTIAHLIKVLTNFSRELDDLLEHMSPVQRRVHDKRVHSLVEELPPLPNFSRFHKAFLPTPDSTTPEGDMRGAFFMAYDDAVCDFLKLEGSLDKAVQSGREVVSACFVTPYPPGFPILVPGQVVTPEIVAYLSKLDVKEIHGYDPRYGLRVFTPEALERLAERALAASTIPELQETGV